MAKAKINIEFFDREALDYACLFNAVKIHMEESNRFEIAAKFAALEEKFTMAVATQSTSNRLDNICSRSK